MLDVWNRALDHVEQHLDGSLDVAQLARITATSEHHVRRMFSALTGFGLAEYVRRRTMTVAAAEVVAGRRTLLEIAVAHGYGSADAFSRAFRRVHGIGPAEARRDGAVLRSQPRLRLHLDLTGAEPVEHRLVAREAFTLAGRRARVPIVHRGENPDIVAFERSIDPETRARIAALADGEPAGLVSAVEHGGDREEGSEVDYWHAVVTSGPVPSDLDARPVPAGTWVVFTGRGPFPEALQQLWADAAQHWFPANPYRWAPGPELLYVRELDEATGQATGELWLPIEAVGA